MNAEKHIVTVERLEKLSAADRQDLCDATIAAIEEGGGFGWVTAPERDVLHRYWQGVLAMPQRDVFVGRLDGAIAGTAQLVRFPKNKEAQQFSATLETFFVAPWARKQLMGERLVTLVEQHAKDMDLDMINLDVRETQFGAIKLFAKMGYTQWGIHPYYAYVKDRPVPGYFFYKILRSLHHKTPIET